jgi:hypothetical protein
MTQLIDPTPQQVREEIDSIKDPDTNMYLKCLMTFGARSVEFAGKNCNNEKAYGTIGKGFVRLSEYQPKSLSDYELAERTNQVMSNPDLKPLQIIMMMNAKPTPAKIAIFKIPIAKKHLLEGEPIIYRHAAIPFDKKYEPWAEEIYNHYQQREKQLLFPHNRKHYLDQLKARKTFKHFVYPVERYTLREVYGKIELSEIPNKIVGNPLIEYKKSEKTGIAARYDTKPKHYHTFMLHGPRHKRTQELNNFYEIKETLALCSFIGWAPTRGPEAMIARYGDIYSNYSSYIGNLLKVRTQ